MKKFNYEWNLKDANFTKDKGAVFSCFACGGGSTLGYKLAGFDVIGCNEIDPKMNECYVKNHNPKFNYLEPIQEFKLRDDLPEELYNLDILDGSPPCSSFSMAGAREKDWGKEKKFREGQAEQVLDTLFFDFIDLAEKLQPKFVVAENVKGLLMGDAKKYVEKILIAFDKAGYKVDYQLLDASKMGVPQKRERVFFYATRKDLDIETCDLFGEKPYLDLDFNEKPIKFKEIRTVEIERPINDGFVEYWEKKIKKETCMGETTERLENKRKYFNQMYLKDNQVCYTLTAKTDGIILWDVPRFLNNRERHLAGSYPLDYDFCNSTPHYLIGMSVPPVMVARIATRIYNQWMIKCKQNKKA